jgi:hypothetical protein
VKNFRPEKNCKVVIFTVAGGIEGAFGALLEGLKDEAFDFLFGFALGFRDEAPLGIAEDNSGWVS